jgi:hypothetical protein
VLAVGDCANLGPVLHLARMARRLACEVTVYTDGALELSKTLAGPLAAEGFELVSPNIARLSLGPEDHGITVELEDGTIHKEGFLVCAA